MHAARRNAVSAFQVATLVALLASALPAGAEPAPQNLPLAAVGPVSPVHPLPLWYQDSNGIQLEPCLDTTTTAPANPCQLTAGGTFNPALPVAYPTNFPGTVHYMWANAEVTTNVAGRVNNRGVVFIAELVGTTTLPPVATASVFTHLRFDTNESLTPFTAYTITHPYGVFTLTTDENGGLCPANEKACDITFPSPAPNGVFTGVLGANPSTNPNDTTVGSFLSVFVPPAGFIGDGASKVPVTGSPKGTNFVRIQGPTTGPAAGDLGTTCGATVNCAEGNLFTVIGRRFDPAGGPTTRFAVAGPAAAQLEAGVAQTFTVTATDANGNTTTGYTGIVRFTSSDPLASLPGDATLVDGAGTFQATPRTVGTFTLTASDTVRTGVTGSAAKAVIAGPAATLVLVSGGGQVAGVGALLPQPLVVKAADQFGNPKGGVSVTFAPPAGGLADPATTLTDLATGLASTAGTLGPAVGSQSFTATAAGLPPVLIGATAAVPGVPVALAVTGLPPGVVAGVAVGFTVTALDAFGAVATAASGPAGALAFTSTDPTASLPQAAQLTLGTATLAATFRSAGARTLTASLAALPSATATVGTQVSAGALAALVAVSGGGQSGEVGTPLGQPLVVEARDGFGNPKADVPVAWATSPGGAILPGPTATGADGRLSAQASLGTVAGAQLFRATSAGLPGVSADFPATAGPGPATHLAVAGLPATTTAGVPAAFTVTARDAFENVAAGFVGTVGFSSTDGAATLPAAAGLTAGSGDFTVTFRTAGARTLTAAIVGAPPIAGSSGTTVAAAAASTLAAAAGDGQGGTVGQALGAPLAARVTDAFGNPVAGVTVTFAPPSGGAVAPASASTGADGRASTTGTLSGAAGSQAFTATVTGLAGSPVTFTATAAPGAAASLSVSGLAANLGAGDGTTFTVTARDTFGNVATGFAGTVDFTSTDPAATLPGASALAAGAGTFPATFRTAGARTLTATVTGAPAVTGAASTTVAPAAPAAITLSGAPATSAAGLSFVVTVDLRDAFGNAPADQRVAFTTTDTNPSAILPAAPVLQEGTGTFGVTLVTAGVQGLTVASVAAPAVTATGAVTVLAGAASRLEAVSGGGQSGAVGSALAAPFVVQVTDAFGNPRSGVAVAFSAPATGAVAPTSVPSSIDGTAAALGTLGQVAGPQAFSATATGLGGALVTFTATATPGPATSLVLAGLPAAVAAGASSDVVVTALDAFGNVAAGLSAPVVFTSDDPNPLLPAGAALTAGTGTFPVALRTVGPRTLTVQVPSAGLTRSASTVVGPAEAATLARVATPATSAPVGTAAAGPYTVVVRDTLGNPVPGFTVTFAAPDGGSISPGSGTTDAQGRVSATATVGTTTRSYAFSATAAGLAGSPDAFSVTATAGAASLLVLQRQTAGTELDCGCYPLTVRLQDQYGNAVVQGLAGVTVSADGQARVESTDLVGAVPPGPSVTGALQADGSAVVTVCDDAPETARVQVAAAGAVVAGSSVDLTWALGPADPAASGFESDTALLAAWSGRAHVTVTPRSACGNPLGAGATVAIGLAGPGSITATTDQGDGRYTATVDVTPCPATLATQVTARAAGVDLPPLALAIACVAPDAAQTLVTPSRGSVAVCDVAAQDQVAVTVRPRDAAGQDMGPRNQVALALPGFTGGAVTDVGDGSYTATFTADGCAAPTRTLEVTVNGVALAPPGATIAVTCSPVDAGASGISVAGAPGKADGTTQVEVTVAAVNACGVPARGRPVQLSTTLGTLGAPSGTTSALGTHFSWLTSAQAGTATLNAAVDGVALAGKDVTFTAPPSGGGGCSSGGGAGLPALALLGFGLLWWGSRRRAGSHRAG